MQALYPYFLTLHLLCAIVFLGFIFCDVVLLSQLKKSLGEAKASEVLAPVMRRGVKIMPLCVLLLVLSGGAMMSRWLNSTDGFWGSALQNLLMIKIILALCIVGFVLNALSFKLILNQLTHKASPLNPKHKEVRSGLNSLKRLYLQPCRQALLCAR